MRKKDIKDLTLGELEEALAFLNEPRYRAEQIFRWIYKEGICDFSEMNNIPGTLRDKLKEHFFLNALECSQRLKSREGVEKFVFTLNDNQRIETVIIPAGKRKTICLSTQAGCKFKCIFCASGLNGFIRNLTVSEIIGQVLFSQGLFKHKVTNFVFMGMGEPLDNYDNLIKAIMTMNDPLGMAIGARRVTVSTCGITGGIEKLAKLNLKINLSVSLHAGNDKLRSDLLPVNRRYPLAGLLAACRNYTKSTGRIITLEYVLIKDKNSSLKDANEVAAIAKKLHAKINLIKCSNVAGLGFMPPPQKDIDAFKKALLAKGVGVTVRQSKGSDISAACGQLARKKYTPYFS